MITNFFTGVLMLIALATPDATSPSFGAFGDPFLSIQLAASPSNGNCLTTDGTNNAWGSCGTGGGGGGAGTWATTTSTVASQLINYSLNTSDIVAIGANSTTTAEFWFDPNTSRSLIPNASTTALTSVTGYFTNLFINGDTFSEATQDAIGTAVGAGTTITYNDGINNFEVINNTSEQKIRILVAAAQIGSRRAINLIDGTGATLSAADDAGNDRVNITVAATLGTDITVGELNASDFGDFTCNGTVCTIDTNTVPLGTDTTGNYVRTLADSGGGTLTISGSGAENADVTAGINLANSNAWTALQTFVAATSTNFGITNSLSFNGVTGSTWAAFCTSITGSSALCDGDDATGSGSATPDSKWATSTADTAAIHTSGATKVGVGTTTPKEALHVWTSTGGFATSRWDSADTRGYMYSYDGDNSFNLGTLSDSLFNFKQNNITRGYIDSTTGNWTIQNGESDDTIFNIVAPSANPEEATLTLTLDNGSGNRQFVDYTLEDFAGYDNLATINVARAGTSTLVPFCVRFWDSNLGNVADHGKYAYCANSKGVNSFGIASSTLATIGNSLIYAASSTATNLLHLDTARDFVVEGGGDVGIGLTNPTELLHIYKGTGEFTTIRFDSLTTQGYFFSYDGDNTVNIGSNSNSTVNWRVNNTTVGSLTASLFSLASGIAFTVTNALVDFGGAILEIPNGTAPVANDVGELAHDTTDNQLILDDFVVGRATQKMWSVTVASTSPILLSGGNLAVPVELDGYTMTAIRCKVDSGTSVAITVTDGTNATESITCGLTVTSDDGTITNAAVTAAEEMYLDFGTVTGAVDTVSVSVFGQITRE